MGDTADRDEAEFWGSEASVEHFKESFSKSTNNKIDEILEELYRAGTHKMYCTEPHHFRTIANTSDSLAKLIKETLQECLGQEEELGADGLRKSDGANMNQLRQEAYKKLEELLND